MGGQFLASRAWIAVVWAIGAAGCTGQILPAPPDPPRVVPPRDLWALHPPVPSPPPPVKAERWVRNPIDQFVLAGLEAAGLEPAEPADDRTLVRRVSLDLRGLPPAPDEVDAFLADRSPDAYERLVDRFLTDPAYGEHRARYWLDHARYADTHGFHFDNYRSIWPYRDWVIRAFNENLPFDRFTVEQLAGDLLPGATVDQRVATGFIRCGMSTNEGGVIAEEYQAIHARDRAETVAAVWLGMTVGCAACHDHKYDPITQREFYQLTAFFRNTTEAATDDNLEAPPPVVLVPPTMTATLVAGEKPERPSAHVLIRGQYDRKGDRVWADVPAALPALPAGTPPNRLALARWLVAPGHPLAARVTVNRFWAQLHGEGLVRTAEDFGRAGDQPENPALLDWLALELQRSGWDVKHLFRLMVTSATYRQSSAVSPEKRRRDPDNRLLGRGPRFRMDGEMVRDLALAASGLLVKRVGGPSVKPYQPPGLWEAVAMEESNTRVYVPDAGEALYRRSLYTFWKRTAPPPAMEIFNAPPREEPKMRRERTNTPHQALVGLNDPQLVEAARHLAVETLRSAAVTGDRLDWMARRTLARALGDEERRALEPTVAALRVSYGADPDDAAALLRVGDTPPDPTFPPEEQAAWTVVASVFFNLDEALNK